MTAFSEKMRRRFEEKFSPEPNSGCWLWTASTKNTGYGFFGVNGKTKMAHRVSYEMYVGEIPDGLTIDHTCGVRCCVNPAHLEPVSQKENVLRGLRRFYQTSKITFGDVARKIQQAKSHCPHGHPYSGDNLIRRKNGVRECRTCVLKLRRTLRKKSSARASIRELCG